MIADSLRMFYTNYGAVASIFVYIAVVIVLYTQVTDVLKVSRDKMTLK